MLLCYFASQFLWIQIKGLLHKITARAALWLLYAQSKCLGLNWNSRDNFLHQCRIFNEHTQSKTWPMTQPVDYYITYRVLHVIVQARSGRKMFDCFTTTECKILAFQFPLLRTCQLSWTQFVNMVTDHSKYFVT